MELEETISKVLQEYGYDAKKFKAQKINSGHINYTFSVIPGFVLQRINKNVFLRPQILSSNLRVASNFLRKNVADYLFLTPILSKKGQDLVFDEQGYAWRLFPYIENTITINEVEYPKQAFEAAKAFGQLTKLLSPCDVNLFEETIPQFHNLSFRYAQFVQSFKMASGDRIEKAKKLCREYESFKYLVDEYNNLIAKNRLKLRVMHNDTKINNVLFQKDTDEAICVIDLDTLMPGYFIYDLGDMVRSFVSPAAEDETDLSKVMVRKEIYEAILDGYLSEMKDVLTDDEKKAIPIAGPFMTYMIGLRFLTDFLNGDKYYQTIYPLQNLDRAANQLSLLQKLMTNPVFNYSF